MVYGTALGTGGWIIAGLGIAVFLLGLGLVLQSEKHKREMDETGQQWQARVDSTRREAEANATRWMHMAEQANANFELVQAQLRDYRERYGPL
jgi:hypothetical protein